MKSYYFLFFFVLCGCSSSLKIQSEPSGSEVFISQQESKSKVSLGKTPVEITYKELQEKLGNTLSATDMLVVSLDSKENEPEKIYIPPAPFGSTKTILQIKHSPKKEASNAGQILAKLHNAQKFANAGQFERAHIETDKVLETDPNFVRALSMKASVFYLQKNWDESIKWYEKALAIDSSFDEAIKMIARIKAEKK